MKTRLSGPCKFGVEIGCADGVVTHSADDTAVHPALADFILSHGIDWCLLTVEYHRTLEIDESDNYRDESDQREMGRCYLSLGRGVELNIPEKLAAFVYEHYQIEFEQE